MPDFDEECLNCLIDILTEGTTKAIKNPKDEVEDIKCLAQCLGIDVTNLQLTQSLRIKTFSHLFKHAEVPNFLLEATDGNNNDDEMEENGQTLSEYDMEDDSIGDMDDDIDDKFDGEIPNATEVVEGNDVENTNENEKVASNPLSPEEVTDDSLDNLLKESSQESRSNLRMEAENETDNNVNNGLEDSNDVDMLDDGAESDATQPYEKEDEEERMNDFEDVDETVGD